MATPKSSLLGLCAFVVLAFASISAQDGAVSSDRWPQFRGAQGGVAADDPALPDTWGPSQNIVWKIDVPGRSWSSPVVWGDHVFVTTAVDSVDEDALKAPSTYISRSNGGTMTFRDMVTTMSPHR